MRIGNGPEQQGHGTGLSCPSTAHDDHRVHCQLEAGHEGLHRNNMVVWRDPQLLLVGGEPPDLTRESEAWVGGQVLLERERP